MRSTSSVKGEESSDCEEEALLDSTYASDLGRPGRLRSQVAPDRHLSTLETSVYHTPSVAQLKLHPLRLWLKNVKHP